MNKPNLPRISGPYSFENLSLFLLHGEDRVPSGSYRALQQAMESKSTAVYETGTVGELLIENLGDLDVFIQAGDILKGGRQDRVIGVDFILGKRSGRVPIPSFCVEQSRWHRRGSESDRVFSASPSYLSSKAVKLSTKVSSSQSEVWNSVAEDQAKLSKAVDSSVISPESHSSYQLRCVRFGRNDSDDRFMVEAAILVFDLALLTETSGDHMLALSDREENWIRHLFERAVGGFYQIVLEPEGWKVECGRWLYWQIEGSTDGIHNILPSMKTDVMLQRKDEERRILVDTKFTSILHAGYHRTETLRSGYLYQIYSYLQSQVITGNRLTQSARGLLLHPSIGTKVDEVVLIQGHAIRFATVDLVGSTQEIRNQLRHVIESWPLETARIK